MKEESMPYAVCAKQIVFILLMCALSLSFISLLSLLYAGNAGNSRFVVPIVNKTLETKTKCLEHFFQHWLCRERHRTSPVVFPRVLELRPPLLASALPARQRSAEAWADHEVSPHELHPPLWATCWLCNFKHLCFPGFSFLISNTERIKLFISLGFYEH